MLEDTNTSVTTIRPGASVAVIGLGTMGSAVARRLLGAGMDVTVWNRSPKPAAELGAIGATVAGDPAQAVTGRQVVLTLLPVIGAVSDVMLGRHAIEAMAPGAIWVQMGTIGVEGTEQLDRQVRARRADVSFVDAPVSGSRMPAETGELEVLASGPETARGVLEPVFAAIARRTLWLGPAGAGSRLKLVLNTWLAFEVEAAAEAAALAERLGISPQALAAAVDGNPLASPLATAKLSKIEAGDNRADFALEWALKDLDLTQASVGVGPAPIAAAIARRWHGLVAQGYGGLDVSAAGLGLGESDAPVVDAAVTAVPSITPAANGALRRPAVA